MYMIIFVIKVMNANYLFANMYVKISGKFNYPHHPLLGIYYVSSTMPKAIHIYILSSNAHRDPLG